MHGESTARMVGGIILTADAPGLSTNRVEVFEPLRTTQSLLGPMWPVHAAAQYTFAEELAVTTGTVGVTMSARL